MLNIIFMGTPDFALPVLEAVQSSNHQLLAVVTQPDRPRGRGKHLTPPPVKTWAMKNRIPVHQPLKIRGNQDFLDKISRLNPDLIITAAYGQILPGSLLDIPPLGCINVHASLLPEYRGASPIQQVLIDGRKKTGISMIYMDEGMDTGDIIMQQQLTIEPEENAGQLHDRLAALGANMIPAVLNLFGQGKPVGTPQDSKKATYCSKIDKNRGEIQWEQSAESICNLVRGLTPWPGTFTFLNQGKRLKVLRALTMECHPHHHHTPGTVLTADESNGFQVACGQGAIRIMQLQEQGGKQLADLDYLRGNLIETGTKLGRLGNNDK